MSITRHFVDWNQPVLPATADFIIDRYATEQQLDLSRLVLVFTGRRASRRMLELLFEKASAKWPAFIPPRMTTFQQFPEMLYRQQRQLADDLTQLLVWKKALSSISPGELKAALPAVPDDDAVPSWFSLCESLRAQHNELAEDGMEFDEVSAALSKIDNREESARWTALRRIQSEYLVQMDALNLWDREAARLVAVENKECVADFDIILVGTVDMSQVIRKMLDQVADKVTAIVHAPKSEAESFDEHGCLLSENWAERQLDIEVEATRIANTPEEQAVIAVNEIAAFNGSRRPDEIAIGIANDALVPAVLQKFSDAGLSGRWPVGMQLRDTRPWRLLNGIVDHLSSARDGQPPDFATLSDLIRHPDMTRWIDKAVNGRGASSGSVDWLTTLDKYRATHLQTSPGVLLGSSQQRKVVGAIISGVENLLSHLDSDVGDPGRKASAARSTNRQRQLAFDDQVEIVSQSLHQRLDRRRPLKHWSDGVLSLLGAIYRDYELQPDSARDSGILACCRALTEAAESLAKVPAAVMPKCTAAQAIQLLQREISDNAIPPESDDNAIDLLGWLELAMDDAPVLILTGFNEGFVPESVTSDVFLPNTLRTQLGLKDNQRRYARDAYALRTMLQSREKIIFISGRTDAQGNPLAPSRLWFAATPESLPERVQQFYDAEHATQVDNASVEEGPASAPESAPTSLEGARVSGFTVPCPAGVPDAPVEIAVTAFREYLQCPYRYFLKRELRLKAIEDETLELAAPAFGSLMHDVLNEFGESDRNHATTAKPIEEFLLNALQMLATRRFGRNRSATVAVQLQMLQNRLSAFAEWQAKTAAEGWQIMYTEEDLKDESFVDSEGRPVILAGRVDRIDQHAKTKQWRVLDYKTSERAEKPETTHFKKGEWVDLQLPLYRLLVRSLKLEGEIQLGYVHLPGDLSNVGASIAKWTEGDLEGAESVARDVATNIIDLKIDRVAPGQENRNTELARVCQDTVIDQNIPWLGDWSGRPDA